LSPADARRKNDAMTFLRRLTVSLLAAGMAASPQIAARACDIRKAAEIPVSFERGFVSAPATIEDKPVTLLIDTGAESSMVTPTAMAVLRLQADRHQRTTIEGTGGAITTQNALLQSFGIGGMDMLDQSAAVGPLPAAQSAVVSASGLLGADWLRDFDVELDLPHQRIALYRVEGCDGDYVPWPGPKTSVVAQVYRRGLVILSAQLDGQPVTALLDSGANQSTLSEAAAARIGVGAAALALDRSGTSTGVDGAALTTHRHRFGQLRIGAASYPGPRIGISALHLAMADMLLGVDWLRGTRVWIGYAARRITLQPVPPGG
jgi:predicted aspartyl protease